MSETVSARHRLTNAQRALMRAFAEWLLEDAPDKESVVEEANRTHEGMGQLAAILFDGRPL